MDVCQIAPDAEWDLSRFLGWADDPVYRASDPLRSLFEDIFTVFAQVEEERLVEAGSGQQMACAA